MLLARLYLNAGVYTGTPQWQAAKDYSDKVINESGYKLNTQSLNGYTAYEQLFMGDNGENQLARQEIIFPIRCDGKKTQSYSGSEYAIASTRGNGTPACGTTEAWTCNRAREAMVLKFFKQLSDVPLATNESDNGEANVRAIRAAARDDRAMFYGGGEMKDGVLKDVRTTHELRLSPPYGRSLHLEMVKRLRNRRPPQPIQNSPIRTFHSSASQRLSLTRAEANYRLGVAPALVLNDINVIRSRANAQPLTQVDDKILCTNGHASSTLKDVAAAISFVLASSPQVNICGIGKAAPTKAMLSTRSIIFTPFRLKSKTTSVRIPATKPRQTL